MRVRIPSVSPFMPSNEIISLPVMEMTEERRTEWPCTVKYTGPDVLEPEVFVCLPGEPMATLKVPNYLEGCILKHGAIAVMARLMEESEPYYEAVLQPGKVIRLAAEEVELVFSFLDGSKKGYICDTCSGAGFTFSGGHCLHCAGTGYRMLKPVER